MADWEIAEKRADELGVEGQFSCPHCRALVAVSPETLAAMSRELNHWDRRFDSAESLLASLLGHLTQ